MAAHPEAEHESPYLAVVWDYDAAPDAEELYGIWKLRRFREQREAVAFAADWSERGIAVGAAVYLDGEAVYAVGLTLGYPAHLL